MKHHVFHEADSYQIAILLKPTSFNKREIQKHYLDVIGQRGVSDTEVIAFTLETDALGKVTAKFAKEYLIELLEVLQSLKVNTLYVTDGTYFKALTKQSKSEPHLGYALPCAIDGYTHMNVVLGINYQALIFNPVVIDKLNLSLKVLCDLVKGNYLAIGSNIIHEAHYPSSIEAIKEQLEALHQYPVLTADIEAFSLDFSTAGIASISFAWGQHQGTAFLCDYVPMEEPYDGLYGVKTIHTAVRKLIKEFLSTYKGELIWHYANYDLKVLLYSLWMKDSLDMVGMLEGLHILTKNVHDTKLIAYLATNSTAGNELGLKTLAHPFAGNWAQGNIKDVRKIKPQDLLQYNLVDTLSTRYVYDTYYPKMVEDSQETIYKEMFLPSLKTILQMELCGMPMDMDQVGFVKEKLSGLEKDCLDVLTNSPVIKQLNAILQTNAMNAANAKLKTKVHPLEKFQDQVFNPNSGPQMQILLYEQMGLPVLDYTATKQASTGADTLEKLINHATEPAHKAIIEALIGYGKINKILTSFIPAFEKALKKCDGWSYLHGCFNLGGTVSGRLSSSDPNLQNIPAGSEYGDLIKSCFVAPEGWLFVGADYNSLEDMISALTTKDSNKMAVYLDGFDGHSLRAAYYFKDQCPEIDITDPVSVNSIKKLYPELRQKSKAPTFLLTYGGTYHGLMNNLGWDMETAKAIEANYHILYKESDDYVQAKLHQASKDGFVTVAFGLKLRTPLLKQVMFGSKTMPYEAAAEGRTAGNALGQSFGLLNNRAANAFMQKVWASPFRYDVKPVALIHDSIYLMIRDDIDIVEWVNKELILAMQWQELPEIKHPTVKLGSSMGIFWPHWGNEITIPNSATQKEILQIAKKGKEDYDKTL